MAALVPLVRQNRQGMEFDAFLGELFRFLRRSDTIDRAVLGFSIVHFARLLGAFRTNIVVILGEVVVQFLELGAKLLLLRRYHCDGSGRHRGSDNCRRSRCITRRTRVSCVCCPVLSLSFTSLWYFTCL